MLLCVTIMTIIATCKYLTAGDGGLTWQFNILPRILRAVNQSQYCTVHVFQFTLPTKYCTSVLVVLFHFGMKTIFQNGLCAQSESTMFVTDRRIVIKTCGKSRLLKALDSIIGLAKMCGFTHIQVRRWALFAS